MLCPAMLDGRRAPAVIDKLNIYSPRMYSFSVHSNASFRVAKTSRPLASSVHKSAFCKEWATSPSKLKPQNTKCTSLVLSMRRIRNMASIAEKSTDCTNPKSMTRKLIGFLCHSSKSSIFLTSDSTELIVPKNNEPCSFRILVCLATSSKKRLCVKWRRTVLRAAAPESAERTALRLDVCITKKIHAKASPTKHPMTKSVSVMATTIMRIVIYSSRLTRPHVSQSASRTKSIPNTKISAPTTIIGKYPIGLGPIRRTIVVPAASIMPLRREPPPTR